jgi:hypothetical protein
LLCGLPIILGHLQWQDYEISHFRAISGTWVEPVETNRASVRAAGRLSALAGVSRFMHSKSRIFILSGISYRETLQASDYEIHNIFVCEKTIFSD